LLERVEETEAVPIAEMMAMQGSYHPGLYQRSQNLGGRKSSFGTCILSRHPLYEGAPIKNRRGAIFATRGVGVIDENQFQLICAAPRDADERHDVIAFLIEQRARNIQIPTVVGGAFFPDSLL